MFVKSISDIKRVANNSVINGKRSVFRTFPLRSNRQNFFMIVFGIYRNIKILVILPNFCLNLITKFLKLLPCNFRIISLGSLIEQLLSTQQDYYGRRGGTGTLLRSYCTSTYTEVTVLLLWSSSNATLGYPRRYSNRVAVWVLHGNSIVTSQEQHGYFSVGTCISAVNV